MTMTRMTKTKNGHTTEAHHYLAEITLRKKYR